jgi:hypothetical protein
MGCFIMGEMCPSRGYAGETDVMLRTPAASLPHGLNAHPDPNAVEEKHKKLGIQSMCFLFRCDANAHMNE